VVILYTNHGGHAMIFKSYNWPRPSQPLKKKKTYNTSPTTTSWRMAPVSRGVLFQLARPAKGRPVFTCLVLKKQTQALTIFTNNFFVLLEVINNNNK